MNDSTPATAARKALSALVPAVEQMATQHRSLTERDKELSDKVKDLTRRVNEAEQRAVEAEKRSDQLATKANRADKVDEATKKLLTAIDRLPVTMTGASMVPGAVKPAIELYGTYEWKNVVDAKYWLQEEMKTTRSI